MVTHITDWSTYNLDHDYDKDNVCVKCNHSKVYIEQCKISCIGGSDKRVESGAIQFGDDWPGIFIRGDHALHFGITLINYLDGHDDPVSKAVLKGLVETLMSCDNQKVNDGEKK